MQTPQWLNRIAGFVLGLAVATALAFGISRNQAADDIYQRVTSLEQRVETLERANKERHDREEAERRALNRR